MAKERRINRIVYEMPVIGQERCGWQLVAFKILGLRSRFVHTDRDTVGLRANLNLAKREPAAKQKRQKDDGDSETAFRHERLPRAKIAMHWKVREEPESICAHHRSAGKSRLKILVLTNRLARPPELKDNKAVILDFEIQASLS